MSSIIASVIAGLIVALTFIIVLGGLSLLRGWVLSVLWNWFVVPLGSPRIGIALAIGISFVVSVFTFNLARPATQDKDEAFKHLYAEVVGLLIILLLGWVVHFFVR